MAYVPPFRRADNAPNPPQPIHADPNADYSNYRFQNVGMLRQTQQAQMMQPQVAQVAYQPQMQQQPVQYQVMQTQMPQVQMQQPKMQIQVANNYGWDSNARFQQPLYPQHAVHNGAPQQQHTHNPQFVHEDRSDEQIFQDHSPGINFDEYDHIQVSVRPNDVPPTDTFDGMQLAPTLMENVRRCRYTKPTPVQRYGVPVVVAGKDLMACAQTGSGKTAAYLLPAVNFALCRAIGSRYGRPALPICLIVAPTRELSIQIYEEGRKFTFRTGLRCVVVYGGADARQQMSDLQRGCNLLVATPGRLWEMFQRGYVRFSSIQFLVLDEADRMLDMGFEPQIRTIVEGPESDMPRPGQRQTLMYSATFPKEIQQLAREFLFQHYFLQVGRVGSTTQSITQDVRWIEEYDKRNELVRIIYQYQDQLVLIFVEKKRDADELERFLQNGRVACASIHGDRIQREREEALQYFKTGVCKILVATDVAARGLDIPNVALVLQYDLPSNIDDYVHRIGRTGRAGKPGTAIAFFNEKNKNIVGDMVDLLKETNQSVPDWLSTMAVQMRPQRQPSRGNYRGGRGGRGRGSYYGRSGMYTPQVQFQQQMYVNPFAGHNTGYVPPNRGLFQPRRAH